MKKKENKKITRNNIKNNKNGITLVALVVTIIVLLILATVSMSLLLGENGIITKTRDAKERTIVAQEKDQIGLAYSAAKIDTLGLEITQSDLQNELNNVVHDDTATVTGNGPFNIHYEKTEHNYSLDDGIITELANSNSNAKTYKLIKSYGDYDGSYGLVMSNTGEVYMFTYEEDDGYIGIFNKNEATLLCENAKIYGDILLVNNNTICCIDVENGELETIFQSDDDIVSLCGELGNGCFCTNMGECYFWYGDYNEYDEYVYEVELIEFRDYEVGEDAELWYWFLTAENELYGIYVVWTEDSEEAVYTKKKITDNVVSVENIKDSGEDTYFILINNTSVYNSRTCELVTDDLKEVVECSSSILYYITNEGEFYRYEDGEEVKELICEDVKEANSVTYINSNDELYWTHDNSFIASNVKKESGRCYITNDGKLYYHGERLDTC